MESSFPNFFIVGVAKAGTSSLVDTLAQHPDIYFPPSPYHKEPSYFAELKNGGRLSFDDYLNIYADARKANIKYIGDGSTAYFKEPGVAQRLFEHNPKSKIIVVLRNPVVRAYSLYNWMVQKGYEPIGSFEKALEIEPRRLNMTTPNFQCPEYYYNYLYEKTGFYHDRLEDFKSIFKDQLLVLKFDDLRDRHMETLNSITDFLEISRWKFVPMKSNPSKSVWSAYLQFWLRLLAKWSSFFVSKAATAKWQDRIVSLGLRASKPKAIKKDTYNRLLSIYRDDIEKTMKLTGLDLTNWLQKK